MPTITPPAPQPAQLRPDPQPGRGLHVLVAGASRELHRGLFEALEGWGYTVSSALNLASARRELGVDDDGGVRMQVDVLLASDLLPDGSGVELVERARLANPSLGAVLMTTSPAAELESRARRVGVTALLCAPVALTALQWALEAACAPGLVTLS